MSAYGIWNLWNELPDLIFAEPWRGKYLNPVTNFINFICHKHEFKILFITQRSLKTYFDLLSISQSEFFALLLFDVVNSIVTSSATSRFEEAGNFCYTYFHFIKDTKCLWNNLGDKTMSFTITVYSFEGWCAVFNWLTPWLTYLICILMNLSYEFISFFRTRVMNPETVQLCDKLR